ncbi:MAG: hypothetical protein RSH52_27425, partial [Janthinobacterium sp.]
HLHGAPIDAMPGHALLKLLGQGIGARHADHQRRFGSGKAAVGPFDKAGKLVQIRGLDLALQLSRYRHLRPRHDAQHAQEQQ